MIKVHIAGKVIDKHQSCTRCGRVLVDYRVMQYVSVNGASNSPHYWEEGAFIGISKAHSGHMSFALDHDAIEDDEIKCMPERIAVITPCTECSGSRVDGKCPLCGSKSPIIPFKPYPYQQAVFDSWFKESKDEQ